MLKSDRLHYILSLVNTKGSITANELQKELDVSIMTIRRDLDSLDKDGLLVRTHGGATSIDFISNHPMSYNENKEIHLFEKTQVARLAAAKITPGDVIFLGPGTTIELIVDYIEISEIQIVTSSYAVFQKAIEKEFEVILIGGRFDQKSKSFFGALSSDMLSKLQFSKAFIGINGLQNSSVTTFNIDGGELQNQALANSNQRFIVSDKYKFDKRALFDFYTLQKEDIVITNTSLADELKEKYQNIVHMEFAGDT